HVAYSRRPKVSSEPLKRHVGWPKVEIGMAERCQDNLCKTRLYDQGYALGKEAKHLGNVKKL
ncbi:hypothetical protein CSA_023873, partial [Cucumis sativus]